MSLIQEFVLEAREYIDEVEPILIEIYNGSEKSTGKVDSELINSVFRMFHSMKGSAGFLSLTTIAGITHEAETLLDKVRNGKLTLNVQNTATLCKTIDLFREMLEHIEETENDEGFDKPAAVIITALKKHCTGEPATDEIVIKTVAPAESVAEDLSFSILANEEPPKPIDASELTFDVPAEEQFVPGMPPEPAVPAEVPPTPAPPAVQNSIAEAQTNLQLSPDMRQGFVTEADEQLDAEEQSLLLVLDENAEHTEPLKDAFRYIHSFKGNCGFMGLVQLEHLSHTMETLLDKLRGNEIPPGESNVGLLLKLLDVLRSGVQDVENGGNGVVPDIEQHVYALNVQLGIETGQAAPAVPKPAPAPTPEPVAEPTDADLDAQIAAAFAKRDAEKAAAKKQKEAELAAAGVKPEAAVPKPAAPVAGSGTTSGTSAASSSAKKQDIRVDLHKLDDLINLVGELVIAESMVTRCPAVVHVEDEYYNRAKHQLRRICDELQDVAMAVRMIPLSATFRKMIRLVHDLSTKTGKKIKLNLVGEETEVDKTVIEQIADPLVHIVRNSCDHGIETPEVRVQNGKSDTGTVTLEGKHEGGEVWIVIRDDGHGLDREKIISKAIERGLVGIEAKDWPDDRVFKLVFEPGFSTADKVTDVSGRGVGMDVVKRNIEKLNGRIDVASKAGVGSTFTLRIPLTLAIVDAMLVRVGEGQYMIPTLAIRESIVPTREQITITPEGREILRLREEMVPVVRLHDVFACEPGAMKLKDGILIVAEDGGRSFAFFVDEIIGQQQTVIKGLPDYIGEANGFSGCTILGDGTVSLIVDVGAVSQMNGSFAASPVNKSQYWEDDEQESTEVASQDFSFADLEAVVS